MSLARRCTLGLVLACVGWSAIAQTTSDLAGLRVRSLAAGCAQCHGSDGRAAPGAVVPGLAGRLAGDIAAALKAYKSGSRAGSVMPQLAKGYSDAQIDQLAAYFAAQTKAAP